MAKLRELEFAYMNTPPSGGKKATFKKVVKKPSEVKAAKKTDKHGRPHYMLKASVKLANGKTRKLNKFVSETTYKKFA